MVTCYAENKLNAMHECCTVSVKVTESIESFYCYKIYSRSIYMEKMVVSIGCISQYTVAGNRG